MNPSRLTAGLLLCMISVLSAAAQTRRAEPVDPASWVPADALVYLGIADVQKLTAEVKETSFYRLVQDSDAKESWGQVSFLLKFYEEFKRRLAESLETEPEKLRNPFAGPVALHVPVPRGGSDEAPGLVLVASVGDTELMKSYYERATRKLRELVDHHEKLSFGSYTIDKFTTEAAKGAKEDQDPNGTDLDQLDFGPDDGGPGAVLDRMLGQLFSADAIPERLVLCLTQDRLIAAPTPDDVRDVLRRERTGESLVDTESYKSLLREFKPLGSVRLLINLSGLFQVMEAAEGEEAAETLTMLGARSLRALIGHVSLGGTEFDSKLEALLLLRGERTGLAKIFSMKNAPVAPPASIAADNVLYASLNANPIEILDEIERMVRRDDPEAANEFRTSMESLELPDGETLNVRNEVLENLREPLTFAIGFQRPIGPQSARVRFSLGHRDKDAIARVLARISSVSPGMMVEREARGTLAYDLPIIGFSLAPTDNAIIFGSTASIDVALQPAAPQQSLAADPTFRRVAALMPPEAWGVLYVDSRRMFEAALELARYKDALMAAPFTDPTGMIALGIVETFTMGIEDNRIETARRLTKYQGSSLITAATTPEGIRFTQIQLVPDTKGSE